MIDPIRNIPIERGWLLTFVFVPLLIAICLLQISAQLGPWHNDNDFAHYYLTAKLAGEGRLSYSVRLPYDSLGFEPRRNIATPTNPPALVVLTQALPALRPSLAYALWTLFQCFCFSVAVLLVMRMLRFQFAWWQRLGVAIAALTSFPALLHVRYGQTQMLLFLLFVAGLQLLLNDDRRSQMSGAALWGISASLKLFLWPLCILLCCRRRGGISFVVGFGFLYVVALLQWGCSPLKEFLFRGLPTLQTYSLAFSANISFTGLAALALPLAGFGLNPLAAGVSSLVLLIAGGFAVCAGRTGDVELQSALILILACFFSPTAWPHYLVLMAYPLLLGLRICLIRGSRPWLLLWLLTYAILATCGGGDGTGAAASQLLSAFLGPAGMALLFGLLWAGRSIGPIATNKGKESTSKGAVAMLDIRECRGA